MSQFLTDKFGYVPEYVVSRLLAKYCDNCPICKGRRNIDDSDGKVHQCQCRIPFDNEYNLYAANIPIEFHPLTKDDLIPEWKQTNEVNFNWFLEYAKKLPRAYEEGFGLYLYGPAGGSGKTFLATLLLKKVLDMGYTGYFISLRDLIATTIDSMYYPELDADVKQLITMTDFLVVDDIDQTTSAKDNDHITSSTSILIDLFKKRMYNKKPLILTGGCKPEELNLVLNPNLAQILLSYTHPLGYTGRFKVDGITKLSEEFFQ